MLAAVLLLVLGVFSYLLASGKLTSKIPYETAIKNAEVQSDSDEVDAIETDINNTNPDNVDSELDDIEKELSASD